VAPSLIAVLDIAKARARFDAGERVRVGPKNERKIIRHNISRLAPQPGTYVVSRTSSGAYIQLKPERQPLADVDRSRTTEAGFFKKGTGG
jgi:hypothetical protein